MSTDRFEMSYALLARASYHREQIGDHGDPYEDALHQQGTVPLTLRIVVKEILNHLRSSLDYAAHEVVTKVVGQTTRAVYFPIVGKAFDGKDFKGRFGQLMPGVASARPDLLDVFASFQPFSRTENNWIADFATLCNESKHVNLTVSSRHTFPVVYGTRDGITTMEFNKPGKPLRNVPLLMLGKSPDGGDIAYYISLTDIDEEVLGFLDHCIAETRRMLDMIHSAL